MTLQAMTPTFDGHRTIPSPRVTDVMLEMLQLSKADRVLEIGTGSGYQTARFAETGADIFTVELEPWVDSTKEIGDCVYLFSGDGRIGLPEQAPFTAIVATCGVEQIPQAWEEQLEEGGRMVVPIGSPEAQKLTLFRKVDGTLLPERIGAYTRFQMLREKPKPGKIKYTEVNRD